MIKHIFTVGYILSAVILQLISGNFPVSFMSFPVNIFIALLWLALLWYGYKDNGNNRFIQILSSGEYSIVSITLLILAMLIVGLFPQDEYSVSHGDILQSLGFYNFTNSWIFIAILFLLMTNLGFVIIKGILNKKRNRYRFLLNHIGLWIALFAGFFGVADSKTLQIPIYKGVPSNEAYDNKGKLETLPYDITFNSLKVDYYNNGVPKYFSADIEVGAEKAMVEINSPFRYDLIHDVYLMSYDSKAGSNSRYCVLQIVRQPWKYITMVGIAMMLIGGLLLFINGPKKQLT